VENSAYVKEWLKAAQIVYAAAVARFSLFTEERCAQKDAAVPRPAQVNRYDRFIAELDEAERIIAAIKASRMSSSP
jgi:hypothetical protein